MSLQNDSIMFCSTKAVVSSHITANQEVVLADSLDIAEKLGV
jgi:hypothetical protein